MVGVVERAIHVRNRDVASVRAQASAYYRANPGVMGVVVEEDPAEFAFVPAGYDVVVDVSMREEDEDRVVGDLIHLFDGDAITERQGWALVDA